MRAWQYNKVLSVAVLGFVAPGLGLHPARAEMAGGSTGHLEEIVVTALKRETMVRTTPLAVSVLSGRQLDEVGSKEFIDYFRRAPGVATVEGGAGRKRYIIRGVNSLGGMATQQATVAQYIDEIPITNNFDQQPDPRLVDIERVEILRGPQGTLFGARSMSGAIRTITRKPKFDRIEGAAGVTFSHTRFGGLNKDVEGSINIPLSNTLAIRVNGYFGHEEGYVDNIFAGGTFVPNLAQLPPTVPRPVASITIGPINEQNFSDSDVYGGRIALRFAPNDRLTIDLMGLAQKTEIADVPFYDAILTGDESRGLITAVVGDSGGDDSLLIGSGTFAYAFDWAQWTTTASFSKRDNFNGGAAVPVGPRFSGGPGSTNTFGADTKSFTAETRLVSSNPGPFQWILGGYLFNQDRDSQERNYFAFGDFTIANSLADSDTRERAVFAELSYEPIQRLKASAGIRYSDYFNDLKRFFIVPPPGSPFQAGQPDPNPPRYSEDDVSLKFQLSYEASDSLFLYTTVAQGFRPGGYNVNASPGFNLVPVDYSSDKLWSYEIGAKANWFDQRLTVEGALFRIDWNNIQTESQVPAPFGPGMLNYVTNVPSARITGLELSFNARLGERFSVGGWLNQFFDCDLTTDSLRQPGGITPRKGDRLPTTSDTSFGINTEYRATLSDRLNGFVRAEWYYTGTRQVGFRPTLDNGATNFAYSRFAPYHLVNLRVGVASGPWSASVFVNNLTDNRAVMRQMNFAPVPSISRIAIKPRTVGVNLRAQY